MRALVLALGTLIGAGPALAQPAVAVFDPAKGFEKDVPCAQARALFRGDSVRTVCYGAGTGLGLRCTDVPLANFDAFCQQMTAETGKSAISRLLALGRDILQGTERTGGRRAGQETCPTGLPEGELLLPEGQLVLDPRAAGAEQLSAVALTEAARGARPAFSAAAVGPAPVALDAAALRGRAWSLTGRGAQGAFECRFSVIASADADKFIAEYRSLTPAGTAALLERAAFFRQHDFPFEYWRVVDAIKRR